MRELMDQLQLDCAERTVYRDLDHLQQAGFALVVEEHRYRLDGPTLCAEPLLPSQVLSLLVAREFLAPLRGHELVDGLHLLANSLQARLTPHGRKWTEELRPGVVVTLEAPPHPMDAGVLETVREAQVVEQCLRLDYSTPGKGTRSRVVEPHLFWYRGSKAYLVAFCRETREFRTFAIQRIRDAELLEETFERREGFDPERYVAAGFGVLHGAPHDVLLHFSPEVAHLVRERVWHPTQQHELTLEGGAQLRMTVAGLPEVAAWVASFGGKVRAAGPQELVRLVREIHEAGLEAHEGERAR